MNFFKAIFKAESNVSSRRVIAIWFAFVVIPYIVYKGLGKGNDYDFLVVFIGAVVILLGVTTVEKVINAWKGKELDDNEPSSKHVGNRPDDR